MSNVIFASVFIESHFMYTFSIRYEVQIYDELISYIYDYEISGFNVK